MCTLCTDLFQKMVLPHTLRFNGLRVHRARWPDTPMKHMTPFQTHIHPTSEAFAAQRQGMLALVDAWHALEQRASDASAKSAERFAKRGALLPRERLAQLLDPGAPFLPLATLAGYGMDDPDLSRCVPGGSQLAGIGQVSGVRCIDVKDVLLQKPCRSGTPQPVLGLV